MMRFAHPSRASLAPTACLLVACLAGCDPGGEPRGPGDAPPPEPVCAQADDAFVREATLALVGHRPLSEAEVEAATSFIAQVDALDPDVPHAGRSAWARALMTTPAFTERWQDFVLDALQVPRVDVQALRECYGVSLHTRGGTDLARHVRDHDAAAPFAKPFTFLDLLRSSLALDDLSPVYRAHLFAMLTRPNVCGNVDPVAQELATRQEVGHLFDSAYVNRDQVCLSCHNSEHSVTYSPDPAQNRHFAIAAHLEKAVFGASAGVDERVPHAVFRTSGFVSLGMYEEIPCADGLLAYCNPTETGVTLTCDDGSTPTCPMGEVPTCGEDLAPHCPTATQEAAASPWGADPGCGTFAAAVDDDPAAIDGQLASVGGKRVTVRALEQALRRGIDTLARTGLEVDEKGDVPDADAALAYLVAMRIVDEVFREVVGSPLTIATRFPRTQAARDLLQTLTDHFVAEHFSLRTLLVDILNTPYFNALAPDAGCGRPYAFPALFDPWVRDDDAPERRGNSGADGVHPLSARTLLSATYAALGWPAPADAAFPDGAAPETPDEACFALTTCEEAKARCSSEQKCCEMTAFLCPANGASEGAFQRSVGVFLSVSQKGFRGLDLSARLAWEERFGACKKPAGVARDALDDILARAAPGEHTLEEVVLALKERLIGEGRLEPREREPLEALLGARLTANAGAEHEGALRQLCGALLASPEHLLAGLPPRGAPRAALGPARDDVCRALSEVARSPFRVTCRDGAVRVGRVLPGAPHDRLPGPWPVAGR